MCKDPKLSAPIREKQASRTRSTLDKAASEITQILESWRDQTLKRRQITDSGVHQELSARGHEAGIDTIRARLEARRLRNALSPHDRQLKSVLSFAVSDLPYGLLPFERP